MLDPVQPLEYETDLLTTKLMGSAQAKTNIGFMLKEVNFVQRFPPKKASARIHLTSSERQFTASICLVVCNYT